MTFHQYKTIFDSTPSRQRSSQSPNHFYATALASASIVARDSAYKKTEAIFHTECRWLEAHKPYYKLWPGYAAMLARTSLAIPTEVLRLPHPTFGVFLPDDTGMFRFTFQGRPMELRSMLVASGTYDGDGQGVLFCLMDDGQASRSFLSLRMLPDETIDQRLKVACEDGRTDTSVPMTKTALRLAVAVALLATSVHRCVEHDVIRMLRERYDAAEDDDTREMLAAKSRRRGVNGWRIGRGRCLSLVTHHMGCDDEAAGRSLRYQHVRGGHFHTVRHGPRKTLMKVMFYEPTIVRPDLPVPTITPRVR